MSEGQKAAEETKGVFNGIGQAGEDIRKNVNSYADNLLGGNKQHGGNDIHPDAKKTGDEIGKGLDQASSKLSEVVDQNKKTH